MIDHIKLAGFNDDDLLTPYEYFNLTYYFAEKEKNQMEANRMITSFVKAFAKG